MLLHDVRVSMQSFRRSPVLTAVTILVLAVGVCGTIVTMTLFHARSGNPIWWKSQQLIAVTLDIRPVSDHAKQDVRNAEYPPFLLTYRDASFLYESSIPKRSAMMFKALQLFEPPRAGLQPFRIATRITTAEFFALFDVPFLYGGAWTKSADTGPEASAVISNSLNKKVFAGANSVGQTIRVGQRDYRVVGVLDNWLPKPKFYDLNGDAFDPPEDVYLPFGWGLQRNLRPAGRLQCMSPFESAANLQTAQCVWLQLWVELDTPAKRAHYQRFVDDYATEQRSQGRFPRPLNNRLADVSTWMQMNNVIGDGTRVQLALAFLFLLVCLLNTSGLLLSKFWGTAPITGLRRALGARRMDIVRQHMVEVGLLGLCGGIVGLGLALAGLSYLGQSVYVANATATGSADRVSLARSLVEIDASVIAAAALISVTVGLLAGAYPAWRIGRRPPASFLKGL
jgi:putative ABC transport system permease protein